MAFRFIVLTFFFSLLYVALGANFYKIQVLKGKEYISRVEAQSEISKKLALRRGQIFFTNRNNKNIPAALNKDYPVIYAVPKEIDDPQEAANLLLPIIGEGVLEIIPALSNEKSLFKLLVDKASKEQVNMAQTSEIPGIYTDTKQHRFYPSEKLGSHILGFVGFNEESDEPTGRYGIEKLNNGTLAKGEDVYLTIDRDIQIRSEQILAALQERFSAVGGTIIVQEPSTGKILALANVPDFNPNKYGETPIKNFLNPAVQSVYEPGSVFKPLTMAAGIEAGKLTPLTKYYDNGKVTLNGKTIMNWDHKAYGNITMTQVIENSINTGAVYAESLVGHQTFYEFLKKLGFGELTSLDLPDEVSGSLRNLERKDARPIDFATASFGQGTAVTPVQLINAFSSLANGGLLMRPYINASLPPQIQYRVMKKETAEAVTAMMESAVNKAVLAKVPQYRVAGKTGTAQIPSKGGYLDEYIHSYVGFAPVSNPRFVILLKLDRPNATLAGATVVPAFRELADYILRHYNIPPDDLPTIDSP